MATPVVKEVVSTNGGSSQTTSLSTSANVAVGDLLVYVQGHDWGHASDTGTQTMLAPGGTAGTWTRRALGNPNDVNQVHNAFWTRSVTTAGVQTATDSGVAPGADVTAHLIVIDGTTLAANPFDGGAGSPNGGAAAVTAHVAPTVSPTGADDLLLCAFSSQQNVIYSAPGGMTAVGAQATSRTWITTAVYRQTLAAAGATGTRTATASAACGYSGATLALKGAADAGSNPKLSTLSTDFAVPYPAFGSVSTSARNTHTSTNTINVPAGTVDGDLLLLYSVNSVPNTQSVSGSWTLLEDAVTAGHAVGDLWYRIASSEPSSYTVTETGNTLTAAAIMVRYTWAGGVRAHAQAESGASSATSPAAAVPAGITGNDMVVHFYGEVNQTPGTVSPTYTGPAGFNTRGAISTSTATSDYQCGVLAVDARGSMTAGTATCSDATAWWEIASAVLQPATGAPVFFNGNFGGAFIDGQGRGNVPTINAYAALATNAASQRYSFVGDTIFLQVPQVSGTANSWQNSVKLDVDANNSIEMGMDGGTFKGRVTRAGVTTDTLLAGGTYNATNHLWWRMRESGGTVYWDTSPDGLTWTNLGSVAHQLSVGSVALKLQAGHWNAADADGPNAIYDNLNYVPPPPQAIIGWRLDTTANDVVAGGCEDDPFQRQNGAGTTNDNTVPWPAVITDGPAAMGRAIQLTIPNNYRRYECHPPDAMDITGGTLFFGDAFYLEPGGLSVNATGYQVVNQWRQSDSTGSPVAAIEVINGNIMLTGGWGIDPNNQTRLQYTQTLLASPQTGHRYNLVVKISNFSTVEGASTIDVWIDGAQVLTNFTIPPATIIGGSTRWKFGIYHDATNPGGTIWHTAAAVDDTFAAVDPTPASVAYTQTITDAAGAGDTATRALTSSRAQDDTAGAADSLGAAKSIIRAQTDSAGTADTASATTTSIRSATDTAAVVDSFTVAEAEAVAVTDPAGTADSATAASTYSRALTDTAGVADGIAGSQGYAQSLVDPAAATDGVGRVTSYAPSLTDTAGVVDTWQTTEAEAAAVTDAAGLTDSVTAVATYAPTLTDTAGAADATGTSTVRELTDTAGAADTAAQTVTAGQDLTDAASVVDSVQVSGSGGVSIVDTTPAADTTAQVVGYQRALTDTASTSDVLGSGTNVTLELTDTASAGDTAAGVGSYAQVVDDVAGVTDGVVAQAANSLSAVVTDSLGVVDDIVPALTMTIVLADVIAVSDTVAAGAEHAATVTDPLGAVDILVVDSADYFSATVNDGAGVSDSILAVTGSRAPGAFFPFLGGLL